MYGHRTHPPLAQHHFVGRVLWHAAAVLSLLVVSLAVGMAGYEYDEDLAWRSAFLNAAMLLGGMGPVDPPHSDGGKLFAGMYALFAGLVFIVSAGLLLAPVVHRIIHTFHWEQRR